MLEEKEEQLERETPFQPKLETSQYNQARNLRVGQSKKFDCNRLMNQGSSLEKTARREALLREEAKLLTFTPKIPKRRASSAPKTRPSWANESKGNGKSSVYDRLHTSKLISDEERVTAKEEQFMREMRDCTFSPSIPLKKHEKTKISSNTPVWERLYDDKMSIALLREEIKAQKEVLGCTFQPAPGSKRSKHINKLAEQRGGLSNAKKAVHERLFNPEHAKFEILKKEKERQGQLSRTASRTKDLVAVLNHFFCVVSNLFPFPFPFPSPSPSPHHIQPFSSPL